MGIDLMFEVWQNVPKISHTSVGSGVKREMYVREMRVHECGQNYVFEGDVNDATAERRYYSIEPTPEILCIRCGLPYEEYGLPDGHAQYPVSCPTCKKWITVYEYKGQRSFIVEGARTYWCPQCQMIFDGNMPELFKTEWTRGSAQDLRSGWVQAAARGDKLMDDACFEAKMKASGSMYSNEVREARIDKAKPAKPRAAPMPAVPVEDGDYDWQTWQPTLEEDYTPEQLHQRINQGTSYLKAAWQASVMDSSPMWTSAAGMISETDILNGYAGVSPIWNEAKQTYLGGALKFGSTQSVHVLIEGEREETERIMVLLRLGRISIPETVVLLQRLSNEAQALGRPADVASYAMQIARKLEAICSMSKQGPRPEWDSSMEQLL